MKVFFGWLLIVAGCLIALTCGLCSLGVVVAGGTRGLALGDQRFVLAAIFGAPPTLVGVGMFVLGLRLIRKSKSSKGGDRGA
jgi:hypothetical protein